MTSLRTRTLLLVMALAGCDPKALHIGSNDGSLPLGTETDAVNETGQVAGCTDTLGLHHLNGATFLCGFDPCNRCTCTDGRLMQITVAACTSLDAGPGDGPTAACSDLVPGGERVLTVFKAGPPPTTGDGGTIIDGVYNLTASTIFQSSPTTQQFYDRESIRISGGGTRLEYVSENAGITIVETLAPARASLNPTTLCPGPSVSVGPNYTATADQFMEVNGLYINVFSRAP